MKKVFLTLLFVSLAACKLQAANVFSCQDSFYTSIQKPAETVHPHTYENPEYEKAMQAGRDKIEARHQIVLRKNKIFLAFFRKRFFKPKSFGFDNPKFISKKEEYKSALTSPEARVTLMRSDQLNPKSIEESLALFEAIAEQDPEISGMHVIKDWLLTASEKDVEKMSKLVHFDQNTSPAGLERAITTMYILAHSPKDSFKDILNNGFDAYVSRAIYQHAAISVFTDSLTTGMKTFGFGEPKAFSALTQRIFMKSENTLRIGFNIALTGLATNYPLAMVVMLLGPAVPSELKSVANIIEKLTPSERGQILNKDLANLPPELMIRLRRAAGTQLAWKAFMNTLFYASAAYMIYILEEDFRHYFTNTKDPKVRALLIQDDLAIWEIAAKESHVDSPEDRAENLKNFQEMKDWELQEYYNKGSWRLQKHQPQQ